MVYACFEVYFCNKKILFVYWVFSTFRCGIKMGFEAPLTKLKMVHFDSTHGCALILRYIFWTFRLNVQTKIQTIRVRVEMPQPWSLHTSGFNRLTMNPKNDFSKKLFILKLWYLTLILKEQQFFNSADRFGDLFLLC